MLCHSTPGRRLSFHVLLGFCSLLVSALSADTSSASCEASRKSRALLQFGTLRSSSVLHAPPSLPAPASKELNMCVNVQDNYPSTKWQGLWFCNQSVPQGLHNSTCNHELVLKDCDRQCGLCACSTARGLTREHCSGNGYCSADCGPFGCKNAKCICARKWKGAKCDQPVDDSKAEDSKVQLSSSHRASLRQRLHTIRAQQKDRKNNLNAAAEVSSVRNLHTAVELSSAAGLLPEVSTDVHQERHRWQIDL